MCVKCVYYNAKGSKMQKNNIYFKSCLKENKGCEKNRHLGLCACLPFLIRTCMHPCKPTSKYFAYYYDLVTYLEHKTCFPLFWQSFKKKSLKFHNFLKDNNVQFHLMWDDWNVFRHCLPENQTPHSGYFPWSVQNLNTKCKNSYVNRNKTDIDL
jgi:hypothetical protein